MCLRRTKTSLYSFQVCRHFSIVRPLVNSCLDISIELFLPLSEDCFVLLIVAKWDKVYFPMSVFFKMAYNGLQIGDGRAFYHKCLFGELNFLLEQNCQAETKPRLLPMCCYKPFFLSALWFNFNFRPYVYRVI